ncbi:hypothetical protein F7F11_22500 [Escherichia coli]|uniref:DnaD N-terminal domain-containing protein n=1 Tax=Escherichia coli TaxID=562 RepID=A0A5N3CVB0_ECOLX|nr:hypothetical protein [Escherichia coli]EFB5726707.1 hypothetical protein [Escherichia coli]KAB0122148.1 hypothetical protein F7F11_22500 [Escherichia coli]
MDIEDLLEAEDNDLSLWNDDILSIDWFVILKELLKYQNRLKLNYSELLLLANFVSFHQDVDSQTLPSISLFATRMRTSRDAIQGVLVCLEEKDMLQKISYAQIDHDDDLRNIYDIKPLIRRLIWLLKSGCDKKHTCPLCGKVAISNDEIEKKFGFRICGNKKRPQSWCRSCRSTKQRRLNTSLIGKKRPRKSPPEVV